MHITYCRHYEEMSEKAASLVISEIEKKKNLLLCAATGNSPAGLYARLVEKQAKNETFFDQVRVIKLDEWGGLPQNHPASCEHYLRTRLLDPLEISPSRYIAFQSDSPDPAEECARIQSALDKSGPIDICILGLGSNGHVGFNEPASFLQPHCHLANLSAHSLGHTMVGSLNNKPGYGLTLGMRDIMLSGKIILLIWGENKRTITDELLSGKISTQLPTSILWLHPHVDCLVGLP